MSLSVTQSATELLSHMIPIIPVIDVMNGVVVRAVGGRRSEYKPVVSKLTKSTEPADVLKAMLDVTGSDMAYVADLDAIMTGLGPSPKVLQLCVSQNATLWIDLGIRTVSDFDRIPLQKSVVPILGTETISGLDVVRAAMNRYPNIVISLDIRNGMLTGPWRGLPADDVTTEFFAEGIDDFILLDLNAVGSGRSASQGHFHKIQKLLSEHIRLYSGGGISTREDLESYKLVGAAGVLVASALHEGTLP